MKFKRLALALLLVTCAFTLVSDSLAQSTQIKYKVIVRLFTQDGPWVEFLHLTEPDAIAKLYEVSNADPAQDEAAPGTRGHRGSFLVFGSAINGGQFYDDLATATSPAGARKHAMQIDTWKKRFGNASTISVPKSSQVHSVFIISYPFPAPYAP